MQDTQFGLIASGDVYMDFYDDDGNLTGFQLVGNCKKFAPKVETETKENKLNGRDTLGQTADSFTRITGSTIAITFNRYNPEILAAAFMGSAVDQTAAAGTLAESVVAISDRWVEIGQTGISSVVVMDSTDTTTYVVGTDYEVNLRLGMIKALSTGSIGDGDTLNITGTIDAKTGSKITGATRSMINAKLKLDGKNNSDGSNVQVTVHKAQLRADTDFDFLAEDFPDLTFSGTMTTPSGESWPFEIQ